MMGVVTTEQHLQSVRCYTRCQHTHTHTVTVTVTVTETEPSPPLNPRCPATFQSQVGTAIMFARCCQQGRVSLHLCDSVLISSLPASSFPSPSLFVGSQFLFICVCLCFSQVGRFGSWFVCLFALFQLPFGVHFHWHFPRRFHWAMLQDSPSPFSYHS